MENQKKLTSISSFVIYASLLNIVIYHYSLYLFIDKNIELTTLNGFLSASSIVILIFLLTSILLFMLFFINSIIAKISISILAITNVIAIYFIDNYQVIIDRTMIGNIFNTRITEAYDFLHFELIIYILILAILPLWFMWKISFQKTARIKILLHSFLIVLISSLYLYLNSTTWIWIDKHAKNLGANIMPWSYIINTIRYQSRENANSKNQKLLPNIVFENTAKTIIILIIGETARSQNFSLYGYEKITNPLLKKQNMLVLKNSSSCSTYTTKSLQCMLSHTNDNDEFEILPTYLQRNGVDTIWHSNNWGEAKIKVNTYKTAAKLKENCQGKKCNYDEVLLSGLKEQIQHSTNNKIFIILHTKGSHGPAYNERYPKQFETFKPVCKSVLLNECSQESLINAYDNTIVYTDYFINQVIKILKKIKIPSMLIYASDHGESLGESGLYLHGTPMIIAPSQQTKIPFLMWFSKDFITRKNIDLDNFQQLKNYSHKNIFHTIMGGFNAKSKVYNQKLDILKGNSK